MTSSEPRQGRASPAREWAIRQVIFSQVLDEIGQFLAGLGIRYMPIKGGNLIATGLAEHIPQRPMGDLDILVDKHNYDRAVKHLGQLEKVQLSSSGWDFERPMYYTVGEAPIPVEICYQLNRPERFHLPTEELFERGKRVSEYFFLPSPEEALLITICHVLVDIGFRFLYYTFDDVDQIISQEAFSWDRFEQRARETGVERFIRVYLGIYRAARGNRQLPFHTPRWAALLTQERIRGLYRGTPVWLRRGLLEAAFVGSPLRLVIAGIAAKLASR